MVASWAGRIVAPLAGAAAAFGRLISTRAGRSPAGARVFFSIPLAGRTDDAGWERRCRLLGHTLRSVLNQTDPDFEVVIGGHERPNLGDLGDPRVVFLTCPSEKPQDVSQFGADKLRKRIMNALYISERGGGYVMGLDADDLVSKRLVEFVRQDRDPNGYIIHWGYVLDYASGVIAPVPGAWKGTFNRVCGSCSIIRFSRRDLGTDKKSLKKGYFGLFRQHGQFERVAAEAGRPLWPVPFPAAVYVLNSSQNLSAARIGGAARLARRVGSIDRHRVPLSVELADEFSIDWLPTSPTPPGQAHLGEDVEDRVPPTLL